MLRLAGGEANHHLHAFGKAESCSGHGADSRVEGPLRRGFHLLLLLGLGLGLNVCLALVAVLASGAARLVESRSLFGGRPVPLVGSLLLPLLTVRLLMYLHGKGLGGGRNSPPGSRCCSPLGLALSYCPICGRGLLGGTCLDAGALLTLGGRAGFLASLLDNIVKRLIDGGFGCRGGNRGRRPDGEGRGGHGTNGAEMWLLHL